MDVSNARNNHVTKPDVWLASVFLFAIFLLIQLASFSLRKGVSLLALSLCRHCISLLVSFPTYFVRLPWVNACVSVLFTCALGCGTIILVILFFDLKGYLLDLVLTIFVLQAPMCCRSIMIILKSPQGPSWKHVTNKIKLKVKRIMAVFKKCLERIVVQCENANILSIKWAVFMPNVISFSFSWH